MLRVELIPMVRACLSRFGLPPHLFEIEITEAAIMQSEDVSLQRIEGLRRDGVTVALDDFGTGYSNLARLLALPMDRLKLDKSLVTGIVTDPRQQVVTTSIIRMARDLGFDVVAEGVETPAQLEVLRAAGCTTIQGYHISRPLDDGDLLRLLTPLRKNPESRVA
jgi:EAL domain-containing protein (putative c-di-GMP-specific phosphodiesterase class I)